MKKPDEIDNILNECLERIMSGESMEKCLEEHPEQAEIIKPLLETALGIKAAVDITPRPEFRQRAGLEFQEALRTMKPQKKSGAFSFRRWWVSVLAGIVAIMALGGGTVAASSNSLPDEPLYRVKIAAEDVRVALTFSEKSKAELYAKFADRRIDEIIVMAEAGKVDEINRITERLEKQLIAMAEVFGEVDDSVMTVMAGTEERSLAAQNNEATQVPTETAVPTVTATTWAPATEKIDTTDTSSDTQKAVTNEGEGKGDSEEDLRQTIINSACNNYSRLAEAMVEADEPVRQALERAMAVANEAYTIAINNMK